MDLLHVLFACAGASQPVCQPGYICCRLDRRGVLTMRCKEQDEARVDEKRCENLYNRARGSESTLAFANACPECILCQKWSFNLVMCQKELVTLRRLGGFGLWRHLRCHGKRRGSVQLYVSMPRFQFLLKKNLCFAWWPDPGRCVISWRSILQDRQTVDRRSIATASTVVKCKVFPKTKYLSLAQKNRMLADVVLVNW